ncbi:dehyrdogenase/reductase domain-containing protein [Trichoderma gracile]
MSALKYVNKLQDRRVLVIGASTGVGFCVAEAALEHGAHVTISSSNQAKLDKATSRLQEHIKAANLGDASKLLSSKTIDLSNADTIDQSVIDLLEFATKDGKLDHVVFTAGDALKTTTLKETTVKDIQAINQVRNAGAIIVAKHLHKYINPSVSSSFTLTGGTNTWRPLPNWSVVAFAGGGTEALARGLAVDLRPVRCNCVRLGAVQTELLDMIPEEHKESVLQGFRDWAITGTVGTPQEVAEAYVYSMKDSFATGAIIGSDGGRLVGESRSSFGTI